MYYRQKQVQSVKYFYDVKHRLGSAAKLSETGIISGITFLVARSPEVAMEGLAIASSTQWLPSAQRIEASLDERTKVLPITTASEAWA